MEKKVTVVPFSKLKPNWTATKSDVPGFHRWAVDYVGGPEGFVHRSRENAAVSENCEAGVVVFPAGTSGAGLHTHTSDEVYILHRGKMAVILEDGSEVILEPLDGAFAPAGVPHSIRNVGTEDAYLIYFHSGLERLES
jgi:mannose-6-phosphate isomerase-like protein (cupin superfamily)